MGHGIQTDDPKKAANIFMSRDHKKIIQLIKQYYPGKLGVYMVPPMFYSEVPEAIKLEEFNVPKHKDRVKGDIAESKVYRALKKYFTKTGDDVIIIHSHKFLNKDTNNEKDFIIVNLSKGKSSTSQQAQSSIILIKLYPEIFHIWLVNSVISPNDLKVLKIVKLLNVIRVVNLLSKESFLRDF